MLLVSTFDRNQKAMAFELSLILSYTGVRGPGRTRSVRDDPGKFGIVRDYPGQARMVIREKGIDQREKVNFENVRVRP